MNYETLNKLSEAKQNIAITLTLNTYPKPCPRNKQNEILLKNLLSEAKTQLLEKYSKREVSEILNKFDIISEKINFDKVSYGLAIFISEDFFEIINLPFSPKNKIKINNIFYTRAIIRKLEQNEHYYILAISQKQVRLFEAYNKEIIQEIKDSVFPFNNTIYYPYADSYTRSQSGVVNQQAQKFFRRVNEQLQVHYDKNPLPIVLAGTISNISNYYDVVSERKLVVGSVNGNFDDHEGTDLRTLADLSSKIIDNYKEEHYIEALRLIDEGKSNGLLESDISKIYEYSKQGQIRELIVQEDYFVPGYINIDGLFTNETINVGIHTVDIISHIIRNVLKHGGDVTFVPPYYLTDNKIYSVLRWK